MPRRPLSLTTLALGLIAVVLSVVRPARAENEVKPTDVTPGERPHVRVETTGGTAIEGELNYDKVTLETHTGSTTIDLKFVRRLTLQREAHGHGDVAVLTDKNQVHGQVTWTEFKVKTADGEQTFERATAREITVIRDEHLSPLGILVGLLTLAAMEIILGIDNVIFLAIVAAKLPKEQQPRARQIGLAAALGTRLLLLFTLSFLLGLTKPLFILPHLPLLENAEAREVSWRDLILFTGGAFLVYKSVREIHEKVEDAKRESEGQPAAPEGTAGFAKTIATIAVFDIIFSLDSVITAVGMVEHVWVMVVAMVIAMGVMLWFANPIAEFVDRHPTIKVLALAFLILIGVMLVAEGLGQHMDKGYIYSAMVFAVGVEMVNMRLRKAKKAAAQAK